MGRQLYPQPVAVVGTGASWESACCSQGLAAGLRAVRGGGEPGAAPATDLSRGSSGPGFTTRRTRNVGRGWVASGRRCTAGSGTSLQPPGARKGWEADGLPNPLLLPTPESSGRHPWLAASSVHLSRAGPRPPKGCTVLVCDRSNGRSTPAGWQQGPESATRSFVGRFPPSEPNMCGSPSNSAPGSGASFPGGVTSPERPKPA